MGEVRKTQAHFPVLSWPRFIQLLRNDVNPLAGEAQCRQLIQQLQLMGEVRKTQAHFPVLSWPRFIQLLRNDVNPLAGEAQCRQLIQQLQLMGEVRKTQAHFPVLSWPRFIQLLRNDVNPLAGEAQCRQLIQQLQLMGEVRKTQAHFPVLSWPRFIQLLRNDVNPLAGEAQCRQLIQQLQLMGEVRKTQAHFPVLSWPRFIQLLRNDVNPLAGEAQCRQLIQQLQLMGEVRKTQAHFPVLSWPRFIQLLRNDVNPLAGEAQCRQLIQQLQLMGEVRKTQAHFPVLSWPRFIQLLRNDVNPLAGEAQCRQLIQQLQLMGEVRKTQAHFPVLSWPRFIQLLRNDVNPLAGEAQCRQLIQQLQLMGEVRKTQAHFPVLSWPRFIQLLRNDVNPLAGEAQCRQLIQQLQLMGEVVYLKGEAAEMDYVVVAVEWLCVGVIGHLLSAEMLRKCRPDGCYLADDFHLHFPDVPDILDLLQILDSLQLCTVVDVDGAVEYEFPSFNFSAAPEQVWEREADLLYGGLRIQAPHGCERGFTSIFPRLQVQLRRSMQEFQDPVDAELLQWQWCSRMASGLMEGLLELRKAQPDSAIRQDSIEITVRGPKELATSCFYFMEDLAQLTEQTVQEVAPGLPLERHFLSPKDLTAHSLNPAVYPPEAVMGMQQKESISLTNNHDGSEPFTDVVCFGSRDVAMALTLGIDLPVAQLQLSARRELAALLDPEESMGRDWSILAVRLGLTEALPEVDSTGPILSRTDQLLAEWALRDPAKATVGNLCDVLAELGRGDTVQALFKLVPLYMFAPMEETAEPAVTDSGIVSGTNSNTSHRSCSTLSR